MAAGGPGASEHESDFSELQAMLLQRVADSATLAEGQQALLRDMVALSGADFGVIFRMDWSRGVAEPFDVVGAAPESLQAGPIHLKQLHDFLLRPVVSRREGHLMLFPQGVVGANLNFSFPRSDQPMCIAHLEWEEYRENVQYQIRMLSRLCRPAASALKYLQDKLGK